MKKTFVTIVTLALMGLAYASIASAKSSEVFESQAVTASLITAPDGVAPDAGSISAGFRIVLAEGWKTYWRTPGEVGIPPTIDWSGSENVQDVQFLWPAPTRFHAFGIENFGYKHEVVFPLNIRLLSPGKPVRLRAKVHMLTCSIVCIPQDFELALDLDNAVGIDTGSAGLIADWSARVPQDGAQVGVAFDAATLAGDQDRSIVIAIRTETPFISPDVFPEINEKTTFGPPDIRLGSSGRYLWARIPITSSVEEMTNVGVTITDGDRAVTVAPMAFAGVAPAPPFTIAKAIPSLLKLLQMAAVALLGGLILNVMPCVLPVLSIKLTSAMKAQGQAVKRIRTGFLVSALGVLAFMWVLAGSTLLARELGLTIGWGLQFQNPVFLAAMAALLFLFAANLFGVFEIELPSRLTNRLAEASGQPTLLGDFSSGAFAAVLATPCSAPFLGTAVAFALAGRPLDIFVIFTSLGLGLAMPYLLVALRPKLVSSLPKPGRWMAVMKVVLGGLLAVTTFWLLWVMYGVAGRDAVFGLIVVLILMVAVLAMRFRDRRGLIMVRRAAITGLLGAALVVPMVLTPADSGFTRAMPEDEQIAWVPFVRSDIAKRVSEGKVVFVDVTADWCLTCKANKLLVLDRPEVARVLNGAGVVAMLADWTRPNERIAKFLKDNGRYGIPFNAVYGPNAPDGIFLPEVLTRELVINAVRAAGTGTDADLKTVQSD